YLLRRVREEHLDSFDMRASHREDMGGALDQRRGERLAAHWLNVNAFPSADIHGVRARRLSSNGMYSRGCNLNVLAISKKPTKKTFRDRTASNGSRADKKDALH